MRPLALYRLIGLTPIAFFTVPIAVLFIASDFMLIPLDSAYGAILRGDGAPESRAVLWRIAFEWPAVIGFTVGAHRAYLQNASVSWMLPAVRRDLLAGTLLAAIPVALLFAVLMARNASLDAAIATFSLALFWFAVPGLIIDFVTPMPVRLVCVGALGWAAVQPAVQPSYVDLMEHQPAAVGLLSLALATGMFWLVQSPHAARLRVIGFARMRANGGPRLLSRLLSAGGDREWSTPLSTERLLPWLRAAAQEMPAPIGTALVMVFVVAFSRFVADPIWFVVGALMVLPVAHMQLRKEVLYPLSRERRAALAHAGTIASALACSVFMALVLIASTPFGDPLSDSTRSPLAWYLAPVIVVLFAPLAQWTTVRSPGASGSASLTSMLLGMLPPFLLFFVLAGGSIHFLRHSDRSPESTLPAIAIIASLGIATHVIHWLALPRFFARADLGERWTPR